MSSPKIVILCLENRSFDEYFGTFPGAVGFYDSDGAAVFKQPGFADNDDNPIQNLQPFRMSVFSTSGEWSPGYSHQWAPQQLSWNLGAMNGWSTHAAGTTILPDGQSSVPDGAASLGYFASNDIPYWWSLARSFLLCDTYFCSILSGTAPNRSMLLSGTITDPSAQLPLDTTVIPWDSALNVPLLSNYFGPVTNVGPPPDNTVPYYPWWSYAGLLGASRKWMIYDDQYWQAPWLAWPVPAPGQPTWPPKYFDNTSLQPYYLNMLDMFQDANPANFGGPTNPVTGATAPIGTSTDTTSGHYSRTPVTQSKTNFENDLENGALQDVSWILPPSYLTAHPDFLPADAECYVASIVDAIIKSAYWDNQDIVLIITHDENDGHFDHVTPPTSLDSQQLTPNPPPIQSDTTQTTQKPAYPQSGSWEPWVSTPGPSDSPQISGGDPSVTGPMGAGFRVPAIIVSPWTYLAGVSSVVARGAQFDHTSIIRYLEDVTSVTCTNLPLDAPKNWRRTVFSSLGDLIDTSQPPVEAANITGLPSPAQVLQWRTDALTRLFGVEPPTVVLPAPGPTPVQQFPPVQQQCYLIMNKTTFGLDEVQGLSDLQNGMGISDEPVTFADAFWIVVDGFDPAEVDLGAYVPVEKGVSPPPGTLPPLLAGAIQLELSAQLSLNGQPLPQVTVGGQMVAPVAVIVHPVAEADNPTPLPNIPQRFRFACDIVFPAGVAAFAPSALDVTQASAVTLDVNASFTSRLTWNAPTEQIELVDAADPYIQNGPTLVESSDLRVYTLVADGASTLFGSPYTLDPSEPDPLAFIHRLLAWLTLNPNAWPAAPADPDDPSAAGAEVAMSEVTVYPTENGDPTLPAIFNFALARVSLQGVSEVAENVRVFFRLFPAQSTGTAYDPSTLYRNTPASTPGAPNPADAKVDMVVSPNPNHPSSSAQWPTRVPLLGIGGTQQPTGSDIASIPFFGVPRVDAATTSMSQQPPDWPNTQQITPNSSGKTVYAFFGCWLDINQDPSSSVQGTKVSGYAKTARYPSTAPTTPGAQDGPYAGPLLPVKAFVMSQHQCLVAEVAYDEIPPITPGVIPGDSDKLVQRNLTVQGGINA